MRCSSRPRYRALLLLGASLLLLQHTLAWLDRHSELRRQQNALLLQHDITPAALFYTEIPVALQAGHQLESLLYPPR
jgi:hypothetical protein